MLRIGITGGIGSGKTTICQVFETLGISVYYADKETKELYVNNAELKAKMLQEFGPEVYSGNTLNRVFLSQLVFNDAKKLQQLNAIVHPFVFAHYETWCEAHKTEKYTLKEAAIMFESGSYKHLHYVVGVAAPEEVRIARIIQRDGLSREEVLRRIQKQMPTEELIKRCDFMIENDGENSIVEQVINLHKRILQLPEKQ
jgi:dephospho-CoA kinase